MLRSICFHPHSSLYHVTWTVATTSVTDLPKPSIAPDVRAPPTTGAIYLECRPDHAIPPGVSSGLQDGVQSDYATPCIPRTKASPWSS